MRRQTETLAWLILWLAFTLCVTLTIGIPWSIHWYLHNATRSLTVVLQPRNGTISVQARGDSGPVLVSEPREVLLHSRIRLGADADALLLFYTPVQSTIPVLTVQLYGQSDLVIEELKTPRFALSSLPHQVLLRTHNANNVLFTVGGEDSNTVLRLHTPHGTPELENGIYTLVVKPNVTEFSVRAGQARMTDPATGEALTLTALEHTDITAAGIGAIQTGERDILQTRNGDFSAPLDTAWEFYNRAALPDEQAGAVRLAGEADRRRLILERYGLGHAETGLRQTLNQDLRGAQTTLRVRARLQINLQTLPVCGSLGTECPVMLRLTYTDQQGNSHEWLQGFYAQSGDASTPQFCAICEWKAHHTQVPLNVWYDYESPDLVARLRAEGFDPAVIETISVYASGHTYSVAVQEIAILLGQ